MTAIENLQKRLLDTGSITFPVRVIPRATRSELVGMFDDGVVKVKIAAAPERGKANEELCSFLAGLFCVPKRNVKIVSGGASQNKRVSISNT